ncbi:hypothetical protein [Methanosarcina sp.]|uniref:carboxylate--amine ligase n=1 Tax=Methanosarcina sp. TaxID=2213 RepID=UPI003BB51CF2
MKTDPKIPGVIVIGDHVQGLGIIRSLGKRQIPIYLVHEKKLCIGRFSKYLRKFIKSPKISDHTNYLSFMIEIAKKYNLFGFILMPTNDAAVYMLSKNKEMLEEYYKIPTPSFEIIDFAYNKKLTILLAEKNNIPVPFTFYPKNSEEISATPLNIKYPVIIKGIVGHEFYKKTGVKTFKANSKEELIESFKKIEYILDSSQIMVQEVIPGDTELMYSFCSFFKDGEIIGWWTGRKIRSHPMDFGTGTFAKSVYEPRLLELGKLLLNSMNYYGVSEIEFKLDPRDGKFKLIEMNARTWLWHSLAARCGIDFPYILYCDMTGKQIQNSNNFNDEIAWIHLYTDIAVAWSSILKNDMKLKDYISSLKCKKEFAVLSLDDPLPFIIETLILPYLWMTR